MYTSNIRTIQWRSKVNDCLNMRHFKVRTRIDCLPPICEGKCSIKKNSMTTAFAVFECKSEE